MKNQPSDDKTRKRSNEYSSGFLLNDEPCKRRHLEMKRRFGVLQSRRNNLECELEAIKICLFSMDKQMQRYSAYEEVFIRD